MRFLNDIIVSMFSCAVMANYNNIALYSSFVVAITRSHLLTNAIMYDNLCFRKKTRVLFCSCHMVRVM